MDNNEKDLVSVLMVNYNHADTIEKSIRSVLEQTYSKLQLIIVDDGSTDNSVEIINSIEDPRIELYEEKENKQICAVTNIGMKKCAENILHELIVMIYGKKTS